MKTLSTLAFSICLTLGAVAQQTKAPQQAGSRASADAKARVAQLTQQLALTPEQALAAEKTLMQVDSRTASMKEECMRIHSAINTQYDQAYMEMRTSLPLTPEQAAKMDQLRKEGKFMEDAGCQPGDAKAAGCCAGGKGQAAAGASRPAPQKTTSPTAVPAGR